MQLGRECIDEELGGSLAIRKFRKTGRESKYCIDVFVHVKSESA